VSRKQEIVEMLVEASKLLAEEMSPEDVLKSNLLSAWQQQVSSALSAAGMKEEMEVWEMARKVEVNVSTPAELKIYLMTIRAVLLGILHKVESSS
jgi:hypothetical protein